MGPRTSSRYRARVVANGPESRAAERAIGREEREGLNFIFGNSTVTDNPCLPYSECISLHLFTYAPPPPPLYASALLHLFLVTLLRLTVDNIRELEHQIWRRSNQSGMLEALNLLPTQRVDLACDTLCSDPLGPPPPLLFLPFRRLTLPCPSEPMTKKASPLTLAWILL